MVGNLISTCQEILKNSNLLFVQTALNAENSSHIENISVTDDHGLDKETTEEVKLAFFKVIFKIYFLFYFSE